MQELRATIVPSARARPLPRILAAVAEYQATTHNKVFVEYVMLEGVNDLPEHAAQLAELLKGKDVLVNLIPWNPVLAPGMDFGAPGEPRVRTFMLWVANAATKSPRVIVHDRGIASGNFKIWLRLQPRRALLVQFRCCAAFCLSDTDDNAADCYVLPAGARVS